jgi:hypothetical protein
MKVRRFLTITLGTLTIALATLIANAQQQDKKSPLPAPMTGMTKMQDEKMNERGDHVMGFDHTKTTHHFRLLSDGGSKLRPTRLKIQRAVIRSECIWATSQKCLPRVTSKRPC